jgi:hypothetical protein
MFERWFGCLPNSNLICFYKGIITAVAALKQRILWSYAVSILLVWKCIFVEYHYLEALSCWCYRWVLPHSSYMMTNSRLFFFFLLCFHWFAVITQQITFVKIRCFRKHTPKKAIHFSFVLSSLYASSCFGKGKLMPWVHKTRIFWWYNSQWSIHILQFQHLY